MYRTGGLQAGQRLISSQCLHDDGGKLKEPFPSGAISRVWKGASNARQLANAAA